MRAHLLPHSPSLPLEGVPRSLLELSGSSEVLAGGEAVEGPASGLSWLRAWSAPVGGGAL